MSDTDDSGDLSRPAHSESEILARAKRFKSVDPFPEVPPALLSSAEILDYDRVTGMTGTPIANPSEHLKDRLKAASLEIFIGGDYVYWDGDKKIQKAITDKDVSLKLPANSIVFVQTKNKFHLPEYIAMRFNLRITHVHRGLLLGTGPLVDPGYSGRLLIPLHNLTSSDYYLDVNKALIWVEFTKTTAYHEKSKSIQNLFAPGPERGVRSIESYKNNVSPNEYLYKAGGGLPIASSIPSAVRSARRDAKRARQANEKVQGWARGFGLLAVLGAVIGITGIVNTTWTLVENANVAVNDVKSRIVKLESGAARDAQNPAISPANDPLVKRVEVLEARSVEVGKRMDDLDRRLADKGALGDRLEADKQRIADLTQSLAAAQAAVRQLATERAEIERRMSALEERLAASDAARKPKPP
ncbi:UNVERIFIED_ORG: dUTPase/uncharacterized coiled-coil protein SlyX [Methylorubrum zatmanii]